MTQGAPACDRRSGVHASPVSGRGCKAWPFLRVPRAAAVALRACMTAIGFYSIPALVLACSSDGDHSSYEAPEIPGAPFEIEEAARLTLGTAEGDSLRAFHRVRTPFLLSDGRVVVPLRAAGTIRIFEADGTYLTSLGRPGDGPGEFRGLTAVWSRGDTIEALDSTLRRITRFMPNGATETVRLETPLPDASMAGPRGHAWAVAGIADGGPGRRDRIVVRRIDRTGADLGAISGIDGMIRYTDWDLFSGPHPLSPTAFVVMGGDAVYIAESLTPRIRLFDASGGFVRDLTWDVDRQADASKVLQDVVESAVSRVAPDQRPVVRRRLELASVPDEIPVFWKLIVDSEGFVWIRPFEPLAHAFALARPVKYGTAAPGGRWRVLSPEGVEVGSVQVPPDLELSQVTSDAVIGIAWDELGVESIRVHALRRR